MESNYKSVVSINPPPPFHMVGNGFRVHNFFPSDPNIGIDGMSPFFLLDYGSRHYFGPSEFPRGVGVHPHRGFETVTIAYHGAVAHHDSAGNRGVIREGDVQWMTAASGILHKEYHEENFSRSGGDFQMVQLWVNLPAKNKMSPPKYQPITINLIARYLIGDGKSSVGVIAGEYKGMKGPAATFSPVELYDARLKKGAATDIAFSKTFNCGLLVIEGSIRLNGIAEVPENNFARFGHDGENIRIEALNDCIVLVMGGEPIDEPIAARGPFVMNYESEIKQAYDDFRNGKFGYLED